LKRLAALNCIAGSSVKTGIVHRLAIADDADRLYDVRRQSIRALAPPRMSVEEAEAWASRLTLAGMQRKLRELEIWVTELDGTVAGWGAIRGDYLEGLYVAPEFSEVRAEASTNAGNFYLRRGYCATGPQTPGGAWPIAKQLR
jgi:putative acetyltransferase